MRRKLHSLPRLQLNGSYLWDAIVMGFVNALASFVRAFLSFFDNRKFLSRWIVCRYPKTALLCLQSSVRLWIFIIPAVADSIKITFTFHIAQVTSRELFLYKYAIAKSEIGWRRRHIMWINFQWNKDEREEEEVLRCSRGNVSSSIYEASSS